MQLILGLSKNNFIAKSENDDMTWLKGDKNIFRLLSSAGQGINFISKKSSKFMPESLKGRELMIISRSGNHYWTLEEANKYFKTANLLGGQTLALEAINKNYITDIFLTYAPIELKTGIKFNLDKIIEEKFNLAQTITIDGVVVYHWKKK